ncbi:T9SS type A sorting domain-containing protein [Paracrocinitomix mangrovi]|uniref:T9SS type A sorting domain-containing protein n=1 Tax=Paracrocinitomix mangrovi TaxID=2862509 RepID=UPI001C8DD785|nr:T9SS type A sorting domain-containing protein [Paracrocinitomix mangrovi]UKN00842.1 T9SS type A sorting domain-containing protein [Paracrocinitomix mangrovi]
MKTLYQCGIGTEKGFEGWKVLGTSSATRTYFERDHLEFFQHQSGNYNISISKKIDEMIGFTDLRLSAQTDIIENCAIHCVTPYVSTDGKRWKTINKDARLGADIHTDKMEFLYVKFVLNMTFYQEGRFRLNRIAVYGDYAPEKEKVDIATSQLTDIANGTYCNQKKEEFLVFSFEKKINIETQNENQYEFVLVNTLGQVIMREKSEGSRRFDTNVPDGIYFVTIMQGDKKMTTRKVVLN